MRTAFIGGGVMAEAMFSRALSGKLLKAAEICVSEPIEARRDYITSTHGISSVSEGKSAITGAELVVLAVKPQQFEDVFAELKGALMPEQTVLSIMAGIPIDKLVAGLGHPHIIRVMPNTPAQIGAGMSIWTATPEVPSATKEAARGLLGQLGREWYVADEGYLDMATALSGSGPAYVFAFIEALTAAGVAIGMPTDMAAALAVETVAGSGRLVRETGEDAGLLRQRVTSPGGTTAEGLKEFERLRLDETVLAAVKAAYRRAQELGGKG
jgi:pyrroline-5-carboxylate reductase